VCPDIAFSDIVSPRHDIVIFFPISDVPCQTRYCKKGARYRVFSRYRYRYRYNIGTYPFLAKTDIGFFTDIGPDMVPILQKISGYTDIGTKKNRCHSRCVCNIAIYRYRVFPISGVFPDIGDDRRPPPGRLQHRPGGHCPGRDWFRLLVLSSADQRGSALGTAYMLAHSVLLQKLPWSQVVQHTPSHWQNLKLETGIIEFQVAPFVTVVADIRGARYLLRVWWA